MATSPGRTGPPSSRGLTAAARLLGAGLVAAALLLPAGDAAADADGFEQAAQEILDGRGWQTTLPSEEGSAGDLESTRGRGGAADASRRAASGPATAVASFLLYALGAAFAAGLLFVVLREVRLRMLARRRRDEALATPLERDDEREAVVADADALAAQGAWAEAARLLLQRVIRWLIGRRGAALPPSLTSREVLAKAGLEGDERAAFEALVREVELSLFAQQPVDASAWARCRGAYERLAAALGPAPPSGGGR